MFQRGQVALKESSDFDTAILNEPLVLLERIRLLVHTPEKAKYPMLTLIEVMASLVNFRQNENEDLIGYLSRFKSEKDVVLTLYGRDFLNGYTENTDEYKALTTDDERKEMMNNLFIIYDRWLLHLHPPFPYSLLRP